VECEEFFIDQAKLADRLQLFEEAEEYLQFCQQQFKRSPLWYTTAIQITTGLPRTGEEAIHTEYGLTKLGSTFEC